MCDGLKITSQVLLVWGKNGHNATFSRLAANFSFFNFLVSIICRTFALGFGNGTVMIGM